LIRGNIKRLALLAHTAWATSFELFLTVDLSSFIISAARSIANNIIVISCVFSIFYLGLSPYYPRKSEPSILLGVDSTNQRK